MAPEYLTNFRYEIRAYEDKIAYDFFNWTVRVIEHKDKVAVSLILFTDFLLEYGMQHLIDELSRINSMEVYHRDEYDVIVFTTKYVIDELIGWELTLDSRGEDLLELKLTYSGSSTFEKGDGKDAN